MPGNAKRSTAAGCKPAAFGLRWFESTSGNHCFTRGYSSAGRAPALQAGRRRSESGYFHHARIIQWQNASLPTRSPRVRSPLRAPSSGQSAFLLKTIKWRASPPAPIRAALLHARVSQLAESRPSKSDVAGSIPVSCSIFRAYEVPANMTENHIPPARFIYAHSWFLP